MYPTLEEIEAKHRDAFLIAMKDYASHDLDTFAARYARQRPWDADEFTAFVKECEKQRMDWRPGPKGVSVTHYLMIESDERICGIGRMRFPLTPETEMEGGNLDFDVPPSQRRQGYGALTLNRMLFQAVRAGLARVLVTAPSSNQGLIRAIEKNRGVLESQVQSRISGQQISRYWIRFR